MFDAMLINYKGLVQAVNVTNQCQGFLHHELIRDLSHMPHADFQDLCHSIATNMTAVVAHCYDAVVLHQDMQWHQQQTQLIIEEAITPPQALERERCIQECRTTLRRIQEHLHIQAGFMMTMLLTSNQQIQDSMRVYSQSL